MEKFRSMFEKALLSSDDRAYELERTSELEDPTRDATSDDRLKYIKQMPLETRVTAISKIDAATTRRGRELQTIRIPRT